MYYISYLCMAWYGDVTPLSMAATMRQYNIARTMGHTPKA
jgi:hypothetical protein